jgi:hypothetical protein
MENKWLDKTCPILWIRNNTVALDFDGFGISIETDKAIKDTKEIKVKYKGKIGNPDFEIKI